MLFTLKNPRKIAFVMPDAKLRHFTGVLNRGIYPSSHTYFVKSTQVKKLGIKRKDSLGFCEVKTIIILTKKLEIKSQLSIL